MIDVGSGGRSTNLCTGDGQEANTHHHTRDGDLTITKLDAVKVQYRQRVGRDQAVERKNLVHLNRGNECATTLANDVGNGNDIGELRSKGRSNGGVTELDCWGLVVELIELRLHHLLAELLLDAHGLLFLRRSDISRAICRTVGQTLPLRLLKHRLLMVRVGGAGRIQVGNVDRDRRLGLVEALHHLALLFVNLLHLGVAVVLANLVEVLPSTVEQRDTDMGLLERTDIVSAVTSHQCSVAHFLETEKDLLLLLRRYTSVDPGVAEDLLPSRLASELSESVTGNTDVLRVDDVGRQRLGGIHGDVDLVIDTLPDKRLTRLVMLGRVKDVAFAIDNLTLLSNMDRSQWVVTSNHDNTVARLIERTACLDSVRLEGALEN